jgi:hypothetical protein
MLIGSGGSIQPDTCVHRELIVRVFLNLTGFRFFGGVMAMEPKDWATLIISGGAFALGIYNLRRTVSLEERTELKPYFKAAWPRIEERLTIHFLAARDHCSTAERISVQEDPPTDFIRLVDEQVAIPRPDANTRRYDPKFVRAIEHYRMSFADLVDKVGEFNHFIDPITIGFHLFAIALGAGQPIGKREDESQEEREEREEREKQRIGDARQIMRKYLGDSQTATSQDLAANPTYRQEVQYYREQIGKAGRTLRDSITPLEEKIKLYKALFREPDVG